MEVDIKWVVGGGVGALTIVVLAINLKGVVEALKTLSSWFTEGWIDLAQKEVRGCTIVGSPRYREERTAIIDLARSIMMGSGLLPQTEEDLATRERHYLDYISQHDLPDVAGALVKKGLELRQERHSILELTRRRRVALQNLTISFQLAFRNFGGRAAVFSVDSPQKGFLSLQQGRLEYTLSFPSPPRGMMIPPQDLSVTDATLELSAEPAQSDQIEPFDIVANKVLAETAFGELVRSGGAVNLPVGYRAIHGRIRLGRKGHPSRESKVKVWLPQSDGGMQLDLASELVGQAHTVRDYYRQFTDWLVDKAIK